MNEFSLIARSINDFFSKPMLKIAFIPLLVVIILMYVIFFMAADFGFSALQDVIAAAQNGDEIIVDDNAPIFFICFVYLAVFFSKYAITSWLVGFLFYTVGSIFIMMFSVFLTLIIVGFLTPLILKILHKKHYSHLEFYDRSTISGALYMLIKSILIMFGLFILLIPVYFIPILNIIAFNIPFYYLFHKLLNYDVSSTIMSKEDYLIINDKNTTSFRLRTLFLYFVSMIPFITLFSAVFYIIYIGNAYFKALERFKGVKSSKENIDMIKNETLIK
ncbi:MAG: EI24 domain-containing protein [Campylobacteraceae bacterium]|nr:EI24 domain-containing protein [Campylobacteraceae bacterium]